jgi:mannose-6-phosphate isomerase-like protein (cupin superfamily)
MSRACWLTLLCLFILPVTAQEQPVPPPTPPVPDWTSLVTDSAQLPIEKSVWGSLQWLCSAKLSPGAAQTVGLAEILPGQRNPVHVHPNCEEVLYMISGHGQHTFDGHVIALQAGMTIRIPAGVRHNLSNTGPEPIRTLISFSSGDRKTVFLDPQPAK